MIAREARIIANTPPRSLKEILFSIECMAKCGYLKATFNTNDQVFGEYEEIELKKLGYEIETSGYWKTVRWK
jgi:hypothetical protein